MKSKSQTLSHNELKKALNLAVRGTTGRWQAAPAPLDLNWALKVYKPQIDRLNQLKNKKSWFTAGITGAALLTVALDGRSMQVWERFSRNDSVHDHLGFDAAGYLMHLMRRVTEVDSFGRNPVYQHYLFQVALAVLLKWLEDQDRGVETRFNAMPTAPPLAAILEQVRLLKGEPTSAGGFRPVVELDGRIPALGALLILHPVDEGLILSMAYQAAQAEGVTVAMAALSQTLKTLLQQNIPEELAHPGVLAAAVVDNTLQPETCPQWAALWKEDWQEDQTGCDMAGRIFKKIRDINRLQIKHNRAKTPKKSHSPLGMTIDLYRASRDAARVARQERCAAMRWTSLPQVSDTRAGQLGIELTQRWAALDIPERPELAFLTFTPAGAPALQQAQINAAKRALGNRQETGRLAEQYFKANHASIDPAFQGECIDMTTRGSGHDFQTVSTSSLRKWIETKGTAGPHGGVEMTLPEWIMALKKGDDYYLVIVRNLAGTPYTEVIQNPAAHLKMKQRSYLRKEIRIQISERHIRDALQRVKVKTQTATKPKKAPPQTARSGGRKSLPQRPHVSGSKQPPISFSAWMGRLPRRF